MIDNIARPAGFGSRCAGKICRDPGLRQGISGFGRRRFECRQWKEGIARRTSV